MSAPSLSTSGLPEEPGASGAVCSTEPEIRRPPGPRNARSTEDTNPNDTRGAPVGVAAAANTAGPIVAPLLGHASGFVPDVSASTTARAPSPATALTGAPSVRPPAERAVAPPP